MGLKKKEKKDKEKKKDEEAEAEGDEKAPEERPKSATELALIEEREKSTAAYKRAQKEHNTYQKNRGATRARTEGTAAKQHLKTSGKEFKSGVKSSWAYFTLCHYILEEKMGGSKDQKEKKKLAAMEARMKKMEEEIEKERKKESEAPAE